jgi:hypothetical protein
MPVATDATDVQRQKGATDVQRQKGATDVQRQKRWLALSRESASHLFRFSAHQVSHQTAGERGEQDAVPEMTRGVDDRGVRR